jgi:hypothetical protein
MHYQTGRLVAAFAPIVEAPMMVTETREEERASVASMLSEWCVLYKSLISRPLERG